MLRGFEETGGVRGPRAATALAAVLCTAMLLTGCADSGAVDTGIAPSTISGTAVAPPAASSESNAPTVPVGAFDAVLALVLERLSTGDAVAASKRFSGQPVTDEAREKAVLDAAAARAAEVGADADYVALVFADQITASKQVQQSLLDAWASGELTAPASAPDLATEVRPILDRITNDLVPALGALEVDRSAPGCAAELEAAAKAATATAAGSASPPSTAALDALPTAIAHLCD